MNKTKTAPWKGNFPLTKHTYVTGASKNKCGAKQNAVLRAFWSPKTGKIS
jgi:hypothetical protein